jgi:hypothetical protein
MARWVVASRLSCSCDMCCCASGEARYCWHDCRCSIWRVVCGVHQHPPLEIGDVEGECERTYIFGPGIAAVHTSDFETLRAFVSCVLS